MAAFVQTTGGILLPTPMLGSGNTIIATNVDGSRNESGNFIGSVVGNDKLKIEMSFAYMTPTEFMNFLKIWDRAQGGSFVNDFIVFDPRVNDFVTKKMYVGDRNGRPCLLNQSTFVPKYWTDIKANLIEV